MQVGLCRVTFHLHGNASLKGKRQVSRSLITRLRQKFNLSVAEVDAQDRWQTLVVGFACVSNHGGHANEIINTVLDYIYAQHLGAEMIDVEREVVDGV